ncbi:MAG: hypothetical protein LBT55_05785 [Clostridiaceae bacterium]|jgi:serine/threonine protein kinase|nr:hypothetical protein [Clostridiaceae bacterium]
MSLDINSVIKDRNGQSYKVTKKLGEGGQAPVFKVEAVKSKKEFALKVYKDKSNVNNIARLCGTDFKDAKGNPENRIVPPLFMVDNIDGDTNGFGYIMKAVDLKECTTLNEALCNSGEYPNRRALCKVIKNLTMAFNSIHLVGGLCYKDINAGNIFFNPKNGDVFVIDNDNIGSAEKTEILGTAGYMAPEVLMGDMPDNRTDLFSLAVYIFNLLIGCNPFYGKRAEAYCLKEGCCLLDMEAMKEYIGKTPLFIFHPSDTGNSVDGFKDSEDAANSVHQKARWNALPQTVKDAFIKTFVTALPKDKRANRTSAHKWHDVFDDLEKSLVKCQHCKADNFDAGASCCSCGKKLSPSGAPTVPKVIARLNVVDSGRTTGVVIDIVSAGQRLTAKDFGSQFAGENVSVEVYYDAVHNVYGLKNIGPKEWYTKRQTDNAVVPVNPQQAAALINGRIIAFVRGKLQIEVKI